MQYMKVPLAVRLDPDLLKRVDEARGDIPRTRWVERALERSVATAESIDGKEPEPEPVPAATHDELLTAAMPPKPPRPFRCPDNRCDFTAGSENAKCPRHGRKVVAA